MSLTPSRRPTRSLPGRPDLRHLKNQAAALLRAGRAKSLTDAQFQLAREYGFDSWPKLKAHVESESGPVLSPLESAIRDQDLSALQRLISEDPDVLEQEGYWAHSRRHNHYRPIDYAAANGKLEVVRLLLDVGSSATERTLRAASFHDSNLGVMELLLNRGADANTVFGVRTGRPYPLIFGPANTLAPAMLRLLLEHGARLRTEYGSAVGLVLANNNRDARSKSACLATLEAAGVSLPDTAPMAAHRGRTDLLDHHLKRDPLLLRAHFREVEIHPPEFGIRVPSPYAYVTPLEGVTLLHMAVEWADLELATWLLDAGADPNAPAAFDDGGFGGWTPIYHTMASLRQPRSQTDLVRLLLQRGARTDMVASIRKPLATDTSTLEYAEFHEVTPLQYAKQFIYPDLVNQAAVDAVSEAR